MKSNQMCCIKSFLMFKSSRGGLEVEHVDREVFSLLWWIESRLWVYMMERLLNKKEVISRSYMSLERNLL